MSDISQMVRVHVNIEISTTALQAVVANSKKKVGTNEKGHYRVDTADALADLISKFLDEKKFDRYAADADNY
jgi:hypothetical protein